MFMDSPRKPMAISSNLFFLFLLLTTNVLTLLISSIFYSTSSCSISSFLTPKARDTVTIAAPSTRLPDISSDTDEKDSVLPPEFLEFTKGHLLKFGFNTNFDSDTMFAPVGRPCTQFPELLQRFMSYEVNGSCPDDELISQKLLLKGCEPLPRRRCRVAAPPDYDEPYPLPDSLWTTPPNSSVVWTAYTCKDYDCLINRKHRQKHFDDCKDCFDLEGREKARWSATQSSNGGLDFTIDEVLATKKPGTIRIGLDIGGGVATFAVRMRQRNITIITTSMNLNGPFNNFIASRGVIPLYISISQRLPFFDNTLDMVHSMHVLSNWIPTTLLHFLMFDIYRVLRPGGLFWLDHFFCIEEEFEKVYKPIIESIGFNKLKWVVGKKLDRGPELHEMYLSALLEKPLKNSW